MTVFDHCREFILVVGLAFCFLIKPWDPSPRPLPKCTWCFYTRGFIYSLDNNVLVGGRGPGTILVSEISSLVGLRQGRSTRSPWPWLGRHRPWTSWRLPTASHDLDATPSPAMPGRAEPLLPTLRPRATPHRISKSLVSGPGLTPRQRSDQRSDQRCQERLRMVR